MATISHNSNYYFAGHTKQDIVLSYMITGIFTVFYGDLVDKVDLLRKEKGMQRICCGPALLQL